MGRTPVLHWDAEIFVELFQRKLWDRALLAIEVEEVSDLEERMDMDAEHLECSFRSALFAVNSDESVANVQLSFAQCGDRFTDGRCFRHYVVHKQDGRVGHKIVSHAHDFTRSVRSFFFDEREEIALPFELVRDPVCDRYSSVGNSGDAIELQILFCRENGEVNSNIFRHIFQVCAVLSPGISR